MKHTAKKIISVLLLAGLVFGAYIFVINKTELTGDAIASKTSISRIYDAGENTAIITLQKIDTISTNGVKISIPAYTQLKTYVYENSLIEENTYSFKFRGLDVEYEVEYKDNTTKPTVALYKEENIYLLNSSEFLYAAPSTNSKKEELQPFTTVILEYDIGNNWVYCITGDKRTGWLNLTALPVETTEYPVYKNLEYLTSSTTAKPSALFDDISLFLNQFPDVIGIAITTYSNSFFTDTTQEYITQQTEKE